MKKPLSVYDYKQSPFYKLTTKKKLATLLKVALEDLDELQGLSLSYRRAWLHKKDKKKWLNIEPIGEEAKLYRPIDLPAEKLKKAQKVIEKHLSRIQIPDNIYSPKKGRSYVDNAASHRYSRSIYSMDIENYFPSTKSSKIRRYFQDTMICSPDVSAILVKIVTKDNGLPQGSPCSPILAYLANQNMWNEITDESQKVGCLATIYADDLTISGDVVPKKLVYEVRRIIEKHGMSVKNEKDKSSYMRSSKITGVVVSKNKLLLPNEKHFKIKEANMELLKAKSERDKAIAENKLRSRQSQKRQIEAANT